MFKKFIMKKLLPIICLQFLILVLSAQPPETYYSTAEGKYGEELMSELHSIIKEHTVISYSPGIWNAFYETDKKDDGTVWDMYTNCSFTFGDDQDTGSGGTTECDIYNREHSFPASWFGNSSSTPMYSDLFHIYPSDKKVNSIRANYPFGEVSSASYTSNNGSMLGSSSYPGYSGTVFEPIDDYKGDFARTYFYMATRYYDVMKNWSCEITNGTQFPAYDEWVVNMLIEWHQGDAVSQKEINRNNIIYDNYQHNRNPYIDHPEFVARVWGNETSTTTEDYLTKVKVYPNPASEWVKILTNEKGEISVTIYNIIGGTLKNITVKNEGGNINLDIKDIPSGIYLVRVMGTNFDRTVRLSISK
jgi:endonuclease I